MKRRNVLLSPLAALPALSNLPALAKTGAAGRPIRIIVPYAPGGPIDVTARVLADPFSRALLLQVEDSGPGIPEAERELVFQPFYRALGTDADGSGLGLPIVLEIARQHDASITLTDARPGEQPPGARFTVRFVSNCSEGLPT